MHIMRTLYGGAILLAVPLAAQEAGSGIRFNGFGGWAYGRTDGNTVNLGEHLGNYDNFNFAIAMTASPMDRLSIVAQASATAEGDATVFDIDYAMVEWRANGALRVRVGRVKQPFGLYTELFHVGTVRPFFALPQSIYGPVDFISEGFQGVSLTGARPLSAFWNLEYDLYGGHIHIPDTPPLTEFSDTLLERLTDVIGGRLNVRTRTGLLMGISSYTGHSEASRGYTHTAVGGHLEYSGSALLLRTEAAYAREADKHEKAGYVEVAWHLTPNWQIAARGDGSSTTFIDPTVAAIPDGGKYREAAFGLNYWFGPEFVVKCSLHRIDGRRTALAEPDANGNSIPGALPLRQTVLGVLGAQFAF